MNNSHLHCGHRGTGKTRNAIKLCAPINPNRYGVADAYKYLILSPDGLSAHNSVRSTEENPIDEYPSISASGIHNALVSCILNDNVPVDLWDLLGFRLAVDIGDRLLVIKKGKSWFIVPEHMSARPDQMASHQLSGCESKLLFYVGSLLYATQILRKNRQDGSTMEHLGIIFDEFGGDFDTNASKYFARITDLLIPSPMREKIDLHYITHSPEIIGTFIKYNVKNRNDRSSISIYTADTIVSSPVIEVFDSWRSDYHEYLHRIFTTPPEKVCLVEGQLDVYVFGTLADLYSRDIEFFQCWGYHELPSSKILPFMKCFFPRSIIIMDGDIWTVSEDDQTKNMNREKARLSLRQHVEKESSEDVLIHSKTLTLGSCITMTQKLEIWKI